MPAAAVVLRDYAPADFDAVCRVHDRARPIELAGSCDARGFVPLAAETEDLAVFERADRVVAEEAGRVVGFAAADGATVSWLYVDPDAFGRGIGRRLLRAALERTGPDARTVVLAGNDRARALYASEGFVPVREFTGDNAGYACRAIELAKGDPLATFDRHWDYDRPDVTEARFRDLLGMAKVRAEAGDPAPRLELLGQIARTLSLQRRFDAAHALLDEVDAAIAALEARGAPLPARVHVRTSLERGRTFRSAGKRDDAVATFTDALARAQEAGEDALAVDAAHMLAIAAPRSEDAIAWNERALAMAGASDDPRARRWKGSLLNNLAWARHDRGEADAALGLFREALAFREAEGTPEEARIARWCVGRCLRTLGRLDEALALQESLHAASAAGGDADGFVCEELAELHLAKGDAAGARPWFGHAHRLLSKLDWFVATEAERLDRLRRMAATDPDEGSTE